MRHLVACGWLGLLLALSCSVSLAQDAGNTVPLGGNAYITRTSQANDEVITDTGLHNWDSSKAIISVYFDVQQAGELQLSLVGTLSGASHSTVKISIGEQTRLVQISMVGPTVIPVGTFTIRKPGYVKVNL